MDSCIEIVKQARLGHVHFADHRLFGGCTIHFNGSLQPLLFHHLLGSYTAIDRSGSKKIMPASLPRFLPVLAGLPPGHRGVAHTGKRIVFSENTDHRLSAAVRGYKGGGQAGHTALDGKTVILQNSFEVLRRIILFQGSFADFPQFC